jgi:hypothetical protein
MACKRRDKGNNWVETGQAVLNDIKEKEIRLNNN